MTIAGFALCAVGLIWIFYKLSVSYSSAGGTAYQVPVYDAAVYPPILLAVGTFLIARGMHLGWPIWVPILVWVVGTAAVAGSIKLLEELGDRPLR